MSGGTFPMSDGSGVRAPALGSRGAGSGEDRAAAPAAEAVFDLGGGAEALPELGTLSLPGPVAQALYEDDSDVTVICGPVGSGKTTTVLHSRLRRARAMPRSTQDGVRRYKLVATRQTYRELWSTTIPSYLEVFPKKLGEWSGGRGDPVRHLIRFEDEFGPIEMQTEFLAFGDDPTNAMRGIQTTDFWLNETDTLPEEVLGLAITRIDRFPPREHFGPGPLLKAGYPPALQSWGQIVGDMNAPDEDNWTHKSFWDGARREAIARELSAELKDGAKPIRLSFHRQPGYGEPGTENLANLSANYYPRQIAAMKQLGRGDLIDRMVRNKVTYLRSGVPVFQREFNPAIHVAAEPLRWNGEHPLRIGLDQGFIGAAVVLEYDPPFRWRVLAELMFPDERLMAEVFGQRLRDMLDERFPGARIEGAWGDMAGEHGASQGADENATWNRIVGRVAGFRVRPQKIGSNRITPRLEAVRAALEYIEGGRPGLLIDPSCRHLRSGFEARYVWAEEIDRSGDKRKVPDKSIPQANVMDALQYALLSEMRGDGTHPLTGARGGRITPPARPGMEAPKGLRTGFSVTNPYGGR